MASFFFGVKFEETKNEEVPNVMYCMVRSVFVGRDCGMVPYGMVWYGMVWYGMVWYGIESNGMVWYGSYHTIPYLTRHSGGGIT